MAQKTIELCSRAAAFNYSVKYRNGNIVSLPNSGKVIVTGDLHGHQRNFERIVAYADLANNPDTHILFQEILHGGPEDDFGGCLSYVLFFDILRYQLEFPNQVHIVLGNHDTAIISGSKVMKFGREMNKAMKLALQREFNDAYDDIDLAIRQYLLSLPLAVRTPNRIWVSHSLPADKFVDDFDPQVFQRYLRNDDMVRPNPAYLLTWGRRHSQETLDTFAEMLDVDIFILGHQPQASGWAKSGENLIILASDHNHGCFIPVDLSKSYTIDELIGCIVALASIE